MQNSSKRNGPTGSDWILLGVIVAALPICGLILGCMCVIKILLHPQPED